MKLFWTKVEDKLNESVNILGRIVETAMCHRHKALSAINLFCSTKFEVKYISGFKKQLTCSTI